MSTNVQQFPQEVYRGDDLGLQLSFTDADTGLPVDLTGWKIYFTIKIRESDPDSAAVVSEDVTPVSPLLGVVSILVSHTITMNFSGLYYYDLQLKNASGYIYTITHGGITFLTDTTIRTT